MASAIETVKLSANIKVLSYDFDPDETDVTDITWKDMSGFGSFMAVFVRSVGTGDIDTFDILANSTADGGNTDVTIKTHALGSQPNAQADMVFLECSAQEIKQLGDDDLRYVTAALEVATTTDEGIVIYVFGDPDVAKAGLTADVVA